MLDGTASHFDDYPPRNVREILNGMSAYRIDSKQIKTADSAVHARGGQGVIIMGTLAPVEGRTTQAVENNVAVKRLEWPKNDTEQSTKFHKSFVYELSLTASLSHPNINQMAGFVEDFRKGEAWIIFPWQENGNVREFLQSGEWDIPERVSLIKDVVNGLEYMHTRVPPVCHGDLKSLNILVSASYHAVITDFGSARIQRSAAKEREPQSESGPPAVRNILLDTTWPTMTSNPSSLELTITGPMFSLRWTAPEVLAGESQDLPSDIWAIGWICWEIITGRIPFEDLNMDNTIVSHVIRGQLPTIRTNDHLARVLSLCDLMSSCWDLEPVRRVDLSTFRRKLSFIPSVIPSNASGDGAKIRPPELLRELGTMYLLQDETQKAESYYRAALEITHHTNNDVFQADLLRCLGELYHAQSNYVEAKKHFQEAHSTFSRIGNDQGCANALNGLGSTCYAQSLHREAEKHFQEAFEIHSRIGDELGAALALNGLGNTFYARLKYQEAEKSFCAAFDIHSQIGNDRGCANVLNGFGNIYYARSMHGKAEKHFYEAHEIHSRIGSGLGAAGALNGLGNTLTAGCKYREAERCFTEAHEIHSRIGNDQGVATALIGVGTMHNAKSRGGTAGRALNKESTRRGSRGKTHDKQNLDPHSSTVGESLASSITWISSSAFDTSGRFSDVFKGEHQVKGPVALKRPRVKGSGDSAEIIRRFEKEATTWRQLKHPHILEFLGTFERNGHLYFVSPFIKKGTVVKYISCFPSVNRVKLLSETADALYYLHSRNIVHGDVKGNNILINDDGGALLCDFGLTKMMPSRTATAIRGAGSLRWMAPELWEDAEKSFETDVYAFGMTISEVLTGLIPLPDHLNHGAFMHAIRVENKRPEMDPMSSADGTSYEVAWDIAHACWPTNPSERIPVQEVVRRFCADS